MRYYIEINVKTGKINALPKGEWKAVLEALAAAEKDAAAGNASSGSKTPMSVYMYGSCIAAMAKNGRWKEALEIVDRMIANGVVPNAYALSAAIKACGAALRWREALGLYDKMIDSGILKPDLFCLSAAIDAAGRSGQTEVALRLLGDLRAAGIQPDRFVYRYVRKCRRRGEGRG